MRMLVGVTLRLRRLTMPTKKAVAESFSFNDPLKPPLAVRRKIHWKFEGDSRLLCCCYL